MEHLPVGERAMLKAKDVLNPAPHGAVKLEGHLGRKLDLCNSNRVMAQDIDLVVEPFRTKSDGGSGFKCEFWGKWYTSAMLGYGYEPVEKHRTVIERAIRELLATQEDDGCIGTYQKSLRLGTWDVWGRKYTLLGLLAYYDQFGDETVLHAARRHADCLIREAGPDSGVNIAEIGWPGWKGLPSCSIIEPMALLYQLTGEARYLQFAEHIIGLWQKPNRLAPAGLRLIEDALSDKPMREIGSAPKGYEMMSCYEGLCEMYRITGEARYLQACVKLAEKIRRDEIMITGSGTSAEVWFDGRLRQTEPIFGNSETCVTATWIKFCYQLLRLTGDSRYADEMEKSLYNALLAAMMPEGNWWSYFSGLMGERTPSHEQFSDVVMSCCVASGPRALMLTPRWAIMTNSEGPVVNLYCRGKGTVVLPSGNRITIAQDTDYPRDGTVTITVELDRPETFTLSLRIPEWSEQTHLQVNDLDSDTAVRPGTYARVSRHWTSGDTVMLRLDFRTRVIDAPSGVSDKALVRGPIVLAFDSRLTPYIPYGFTPPLCRYQYPTDAQSLDVKLAANRPFAEIWMTFDVPFVDEAGREHIHQLCDFSSAGNTWTKGNVLRVWMPQPFDWRHIYINNATWMLDVDNDRVSDDSRPQVPSRYRCHDGGIPDRDA